MSRKPYDDRLTGWKMNKIKSDPAQGSERFTPAVLLAAKPPTSNHEHGSRNIPSPKQNLVSSTGRAAWYPYYAGYSPSFVRFILENSNLRSDAVVLDPWNGAGTTTQVATDLGYDTFGFDLNPVMVLVAKARLLNEGQRLDIISCVDKIARKANRFGAGNATHDDALGTWFSEQSVTWIRHLERAIRDQFKIGKGRVRENVSNYESDAAFAYMMLFRTLRSFLTGFKVSNPAWLKPAGSETDLVTISRVDLLNKFKITCDKILKDVDDGLFASLQGKRGESRIELANSVSLPLASCTADIVVASPPYCTRIDYAIATRVELAILNVGATDALRKLRENMIGTSTIDSKPVTISETWGVTCTETLARIERHQSKSSKCYYLKTYMQYFDGIFQSLAEIDRCLKKNGECVLVLQDSYYKDIHINLANIFSEMTETFGWELIDRSDFRVSKTMADLNPRSRRYRRFNSATECVLWFRSK